MNCGNLVGLTMLRIMGLSCVFLVTCSCTNHDRSLRQAAAKKTATENAEELAESFLKGDYKTIVAYTDDSVVEKMGGRQQAIKSIEASMKQQISKGITLKRYEIGRAGDPANKNGMTFIIIPTTVELVNSNSETAVGQSYLLGISSNGGKSWKFFEGAGVDNMKDQIMSKLPAELVLPEYKRAIFVGDISD